MADYYEEMGWRPLQDGEHPNHLLDIARFLLDYGRFEENGSAEWRRLPPPASKKAVQKLEELANDNAEKQCPVCLKHFKIGEMVKKMPCNHVFHAECILTWLDKTNSCPCCRFELETDDRAYESFKKEKKRAKERQEELDNLHNSMFS